ncbi:MAG: hypothetical protein ACAI44_26960, partial [Candidatus Sericytochromatia bacterium]
EVAKVVVMADKSAGQSMLKRAKMFDGVSSSDDILRVLRADQKLAAHYTGDAYKSIAKGTGGKILLQDAILLERSGLLNKEQVAFLNELMGKVSKGTISKLSSEDIQKLDQMVEGIIAQLDGTEVGEVSSDSKLMNVDEQALGGVNPNDPAAHDQNVAVVEENSDDLFAAADADIHESQLASKEVGLLSEQVKAQNDKNVAIGRTFSRITDSINRIGTEIDLIKNKALPVLQKEVESLNQQVEARVAELKGKGLSDDEVLNDPKLKELVTKQKSARIKYEGLSGKLTELYSAQANALKTLKSLKTIDAELKQRLGGVSVMSGKLTEGTTKLTSLNDAISNLPNNRKLFYSNMIAKYERIANGNFPQNLKDAANRAIGLLKEHQGNNSTIEAMMADPRMKNFVGEMEGQFHVDELKAQEQELKNIKGEVVKVHDQMIAGMEDLIRTYKSTKTASPKTIELLEAELATLKALKTSGKEGEALLTELTKSRAQIVSALEGLVPQHLDSRELIALKGLDGKVGAYSIASIALDGNYETTQKALTQEITKAEERAKDNTAVGKQVIDDMIELESGHGGGEHESLISLAYGSHVRLSLGLSGGVGGSIGGKNVGVTARIGVGVEASLTVEKAYGRGPAYRAHIDLDAKIEGELSLKAWFIKVGVKVEASAGWSGGLAFNDLGEAKAFGAQIVKVLALSQLDLSDESNRDLLMKEVGVLEDMFNKHKYTGTHTQVKVEAEASAGHVGVGAGYTTRTETNSYGNGTTVEDKTKDYEGKIEWGHHKEIKVKYLEQTSTVLGPNGQPQGEPATLKSFHIKVPAAMVLHALEHAGKAGKGFSTLCNKMGKAFQDEFIASFKALNPGAAAMGVAEILELVDGIMRNNYDIFAKTAQTSKFTGESEILIGIECANKPPKPAHWALEVGIEAKYSAEVTANAGIFYGKVSASAEYELAAAISLPIGHHEEPPKGAPQVAGGGHH